MRRGTRLTYADVVVEKQNGKTDVISNYSYDDDDGEDDDENDNNYNHDEEEPMPERCPWILYVGNASSYDYDGSTSVLKS